jgi:predicted ATPase
MAIPNATIYLFEQEVIQEVAYDQIPSVQFMKKFLQYPELFIQHLDNNP